MKNFLLAILLTVLLLPVLAQAAPDIGLGTAGQIATNAGYEKADELSLSKQVGKYIRVALSLTGTIFLTLTIYAGFLWMTASGNEDKVTEAKSIIMRASMGLLIALAAFSITAFIMSVTTTGAIKSGSSNNVGGSSASSGSSNCTEGFFTCWYQGFKNAASSSPAGVPK